MVDRPHTYYISLIDKALYRWDVPFEDAPVVAARLTREGVWFVSIPVPWGVEFAVKPEADQRLRAIVEDIVR